MYDNQRYEDLAFMICKTTIENFELAYKKYLITGETWSKDKYLSNQINHLKDLVNFIMTDTFYMYSGGVDSHKLLLGLCYRIEEEIGWTKEKKLSIYLENLSKQEKKSMNA